MNATTILFRPVGPRELSLVAESGYRRFPPRLPEQPIFYPVCNERYATEIARYWNAKLDGGGFVTRFAVETEFLSSYRRHVVGSSHHEEYWIPSDELAAFNEAIVGTIDVIAVLPPSA
ncbi:MAG: ADP-ribosylation/crystallin J1 [Polyangiaceae bacterium]